MIELAALADISVAVPYLVTSHPQHGEVSAHIGTDAVGLTAHSAIETYSVLTRLPADAQLSPADAAAAIHDNFPEVVTLPPGRLTTFTEELAEAGIAGGAAYDALIAATAAANSRTLLTRDARAAATYAAFGAAVEFVG